MIATLWVCKCLHRYLDCPAVGQVTGSAPILAVVDAISVVHAKSLVAWSPCEIVAVVAHIFAICNPVCVLTFGGQPPSS